MTPFIKKKDIKKEKQEKQNAKQKLKEEKKLEKMRRNVNKIKSLNNVLDISKKNTNVLQGIEKNNIISRKPGKRLYRDQRMTRSKSPIRRGGSIIQKGGDTQADILFGDKLQELFEEVEIIKFLNQTHQHNYHSVAYMPNNIKIMGDNQNRQSNFVLNFSQKVQNFALNRNV